MHVHGTTRPDGSLIRRLAGTALIVALAACGGGGGSSTDAPAAQTGTPAPGSESGSQTSGSTTSTGNTATPPTTPAATLPALDQVACGTPFKAPGQGVTVGSDLVKVTLPTATGAVCNDGSPAIMYIRPAADAANQGNWMIYLQGGGECAGDDTACIDRWCGRQAPYDGSKMSSKFAPVAMKGSGALAREDRNAFGKWNQVFLYYCSSDNWAGRQSNVEVADTRTAGAKYGVHFRGRSIVESAVERLLANEVSSDTDPNVKLPRLNTATRVLFSGSSGGGGGVMANGDWFASRFSAAGTDVRLVMDASLFPLFEDVSNTIVRDAVRNQFIAKSGWLTLTNAHVDQSCAAVHTGANLWNCDWNPHIRLNHLTTPLFQRQDLADPVNYKPFQAAGATLLEFGTWQRLTALRVPQIQQPAYEEAAAKTRPGAIYATGCGQHIAMINDDWFFTATMNDAGGVARSFHDALNQWIGGANVNIVETIPRRTTSVCPATTGEGG